MIPYGRQDIDEDDIRAVTDVLRSDWLTQGPSVPRFEETLANLCQVEHGVAFSNATAALHVACMAMDLGPGDVLWTSPNTFVASANCARYCGAQVDFVDIDPRTYNISVPALAARLEHAGRAGKLPKILVPVHFAGQSCEMRAIRVLADRYRFGIIEDASHAVGGRYLDQPVGNCRFSDITVFSFHPVKIVTTGEGGMAMTKSAALAERMRLFRSHGITREPSLMTRQPEGDWFYEQIALGYNYRMTDIQAALGISQLERLQAFVARRREIADRYGAALKALPLTTPWQHPDAESAYHLYPIVLADRGRPDERLRVFAEMRRAGVHVNVHYIPVHTQPYYRDLGFSPGDFPEAEKYYRNAISLPMYAALSASQQNTVVQILEAAL